MFFMRKSIKGMLIMTFVAVIMIPAIIMGFVAKSAIENKLEQEIARENMVLARSLSIEVDEILSEAEQVITLVGSLLQSEIFAPQQDIDTLLARVTTSFRSFSSIQVLDQDGIIRYSSQSNVRQAGYDLSRHPTFTHAQQSADEVWSASFIPLKSGGKPTVSISKRFGSWVVAGYLDLSALSKTINTLADQIGLRATITDREGTIVASSEEFQADYRVNIRSHVYVQNALSGTMDTYRLPDEDGRDMIISVTRTTVTDLLVVVYRDARLVLKPVIYIQQIFMILLIAAGIVSIGVTIYALKSILSPFSHLITTTNNIARGRYDVEFERCGMVEFHQLEQNFVFMSEAIHAREKALKEAINKAEAANQAKSVFLANMSHELRTPLNAILGFAQLVARNPHIPPAEQENLAIIQRSGEHLLALINQVLDLAKIEAGRITLNEKDFDLHRLLADLHDMFSLRTQSKGLGLMFERDDDLPQYVRTDEVKLRQVLINLLNNAVKFTEIGEIRLSVSSEQLSVSSDQLLVPQEKPNTDHELLNTDHELLNTDHELLNTDHCLLKTDYRLLFTVRDTGPGIPPQEMDTLFEAFTQTHTGRQAQEGTGLGLTISRQFVKLMGGDITVNSEVGRGSTFAFEIRAAVVQKEEFARQDSIRRVIGVQPGQPRYRLLVVDDTPDNRALLVKLLAPYNFELREATNGQEAIELWERWAPHLIWMDLRMPVLDGIEATRYIKSQPKGEQTMVIMLSASIIDEDHTQALEAGCDDFLPKPFRETAIFDMLSRHVGIRFVYADADEHPASTEQQPESDVVQTTASAAIPHHLLAALEHAVVTTDMMRILELIQEIHRYDILFAEELKRCADNFEYTKILEHLQQRGS